MLCSPQQPVLDMTGRGLHVSGGDGTPSAAWSDDTASLHSSCYFATLRELLRQVALLTAYNAGQAAGWATGQAEDQ